VVCEGVVTEPFYFKDLRKVAECQLVEIVVVDLGAVPKTVVEEAVRRKRAAEDDASRQNDDFLRYDEVWCVFDVDQHPRLPDARQQARANKIRLAISNPSFELWALLHLQDQTAHLDRKEARRLLVQHIPTYQKQLPFALIHQGYSQALRRALTLRQRRAEAQDAGGNPSTDVGLLTQRMHELGRK